MNDDKVDDIGGGGGVMFGFEASCGDSVLVVLAVLEMIFLSVNYILCK